MSGMSEMSVSPIKVIPSSLLEKISSYLPQKDYINFIRVSRLFASLYQYHDADYWQSHFVHQVMMKYRTQREMRLVAKFSDYCYIHSWYAIHSNPLDMIPKELRDIASLWWSPGQEYWVPFGQSFKDEEFYHFSIVLMIAIVLNSNVGIIPYKYHDEYSSLYINLKWDFAHMNNMNNHDDYSSIIHDDDKGKWNENYCKNIIPSSPGDEDNKIVRKYIRWSYVQLQRKCKIKKIKIMCL